MADRVQHRVQPWRSPDGQRPWLFKLVAAMEQASEPKYRARPCDRNLLAQFRAQLARPVSRYPNLASPFGRLN
jgi:hypothetical protein